jgi:hypothetical protein
MNHFKNSLFTLFFIGIFSWTNAQSNLLQYIPSDATFVFSMNPNNLNSKVNLRQLKEYDFYNMAMMQMAGSMGAGSEEIMDVLADPETIGLDLMSSSHFFGKIKDNKTQFGFLFNVSDETKFTSFLKEVNPQGFEGNQYSKQPGYNLMKVSEDAWFSWNGEMAFIGGCEIEMNVDWDDAEAVKESKEK